MSAAPELAGEGEHGGVVVRVSGTVTRWQWPCNRRYVGREVAVAAVVARKRSRSTVVRAG
jgi:hypothetical protein